MPVLLLLGPLFVGVIAAAFALAGAVVEAGVSRLRVDLWRLHDDLVDDLVAQRLADERSAVRLLDLVRRSIVEAKQLTALRVFGTFLLYRLSAGNREIARNRILRGETRDPAGERLRAPSGPDPVERRVRDDHPRSVRQGGVPARVHGCPDPAGQGCLRSAFLSADHRGSGAHRGPAGLRPAPRSARPSGRWPESPADPAGLRGLRGRWADAQPRFDPLWRARVISTLVSGTTRPLRVPAYLGIF